MQPSSSRISAARFDARGYLPIIPSQEERPCCDSNCLGLACTRRRTFINDMIAEAETLNASIKQIFLRSDGQRQSVRRLLRPPECLAWEIGTRDDLPKHSSRVAKLGIDQALAFVFDLLRSNVANLRDLTSQSYHPLGEGVDYQPGTTAAATVETRDVMKRRFDPNTNAEPPFLPRSPNRDQDPSRTIPQPFQGSRNSLSPCRPPPGTHPISGGNAFTRPQLPTHNHPPPCRVLPSLKSLNIPPPSTIYTPTSPSPSLLRQPSSFSVTHLAHLQDLKHQVSLKSLALQTLQQEYDTLLSKLDRQHTKCVAVEKKFEVTNVEINSLTTEKENLKAKVVALEQQLKELRKQRNDLRRREAQTGEQYRSIVEMASLLQGMAAEEKRAWMQERESLLWALGRDNSRGREHRVEDDIGRNNLPPATDIAVAGLDSIRSLGANLSVSHTEQASASTTSHVIAALRIAVAQLRSRIQELDFTIRIIRDHGTAMEEASQAFMGAGKEMREVAGGEVGDS